MVFPNFSKPFTFDWSVESDCLAARVANRGFGMKERGSKVGLAETRMAWNCLEKEELALENMHIDGIQCDAILTLLLINYLNRLMQGGGVQNLSKVVNQDVGAQCDVEAVVGRGDDAKLKETCNGFVLHVQIERRGCFGDVWLKNIKTKLKHATKVVGVRKGVGNQEGTRFKEGEMVVKEEDVLGVAALKGSLELRTIPFQEGEDDPNRVSFNSDVDRSRRLMTRTADVAGNKDGVGCGEESRSRADPIIQGYLQQVCVTMNLDNPEFLQAMREVIRALQDEEGDRDRYLEWERKIERVFEFKDIEDDMACKLAILKLSGGASLWYDGLKSRRNR
ncbi:hypothetical protein LXL04_020542 [Taraxacum kok-saghyz]